MKSMANKLTYHHHLWSSLKFVLFWGRFVIWCRQSWHPVNRKTARKSPAVPAECRSLLHQARKQCKRGFQESLLDKRLMTYSHTTFLCHLWKQKIRKYHTMVLPCCDTKHSVFTHSAVNMSHAFVCRLPSGRDLKHMKSTLQGCINNPRNFVLPARQILLSW